MYYFMKNVIKDGIRYEDFYCSKILPHIVISHCNSSINIGVGENILTLFLIL